ncbi:MAG: AraC family transcriptional regulator [Bacteroidales bacterium]|nr:AraC family transcriptional regulator [Bacteroidales bacterium]
MIRKKSLSEITVLQLDESRFEQIDLDGEMQITYIEKPITNFPDYFRNDVFAIQFLIRGSITADINHQRFTIQAPAEISLFPNHVLSSVEVSDDCQLYVLSFSMQFGEDLNLNVSSEIQSKIYIHPIMNLKKEQVDVCVQYLSLLKNAIRSLGITNAYEVAHSLVHSLCCYMAGYYDESFNTQFSLSRAEEHVGRFLSLVDIYSSEHHDIGWYASQLCLAPQYLAKIVKKVLRRSAGDCIVENLVRQSKALLLTTKLPVQEITDRLGFKNQSHFGTFFRRATGVSPRAYRESHRANHRVR